MAKLPITATTIYLGADVPRSNAYKSLEITQNTPVLWSKHKAELNKQRNLSQKAMNIRSPKDFITEWISGKHERDRETRWPSARINVPLVNTCHPTSAKPDVAETDSKKHERKDEFELKDRQGVPMTVATMQMTNINKPIERQESKYDFAPFKHNRIRRLGKKQEKIEDNMAAQSNRTPRQAQHYEYKVVEEAYRPLQDPLVLIHHPQTSRGKINQNAIVKLEPCRKSLSYETYEKAYERQEEEQGSRFIYLRKHSTKSGDIRQGIRPRNSLISHDRVYEFDLPLGRGQRYPQTRSTSRTHQLAPLSRQKSMDVNFRHNNSQKNRLGLQPKYASQPNLTQPPMTDDPRSWPVPPPTPFVPHNPPPSAASWHRDTGCTRLYSPERYLSPGTYRREQEVDSLYYCHRWFLIREDYGLIEFHLVLWWMVTFVKHSIGFAYRKHYIEINIYYVQYIYSS